MTQKSELGRCGEDIASKYIAGKGYKIIERNHWRPWGELDIIGIASDKTLIFFEVKTMRQSGNDEIAALQPEDQMTAAKVHKFKKAAEMFAGKHPELINDKKGWRLDLICVVTPENTDKLTDIVKYCKIKHYENI